LSSSQFTNLQEINQDIGPSYLYNRSKLAQALFVWHLSKLLLEAKDMQHASQRHINATHPGDVQTDQQKQAEEAYGRLGKIGAVVVKPLMKDPVAQGCRPALWAATSPEVEEGNVDGQYIVPDKKVMEPSSQAKGAKLAERLWVFCESALKEKLRELSYTLGV
jgi:WW domain-containing oxidoreductase